MEKQKKVLNVIKGYMSKFDIEQVTIIEDDKESVIFSGDVEKFLHPCETMQNEACAWHGTHWRSTAEVQETGNSQRILYLASHSAKMANLQRSI